LWWLPSIVILSIAVIISLQKDFAPANKSVLSWFLLALGVITVPKVVYSLCSFLGWRYCKWRKKRINWGNLLGLTGSLFVIYVVAYGSTIGFRKLEVNRLDYTFDNLPDAFDGYKIVQFSDIHVGTFDGDRVDILQNAIDTINAQDADAICFCGDIQNLRPTELYPVMDMLQQLKAKDGVFSVLGNHDYSYYTRHDDPAVRAANERETINRERQLGWQLLLNEHRSVCRGSDSIVIAGMENLTEVKSSISPDYPVKGDLRKTLQGVGADAFVVLLQHEPSVWRSVILPERKVPLTLSGHTHGGQISFFGFSPIGITKKEWCGEYREGNSILNISKGVGGLIPIRFGATAEVVVITLHKKK
jgi:Predicted phosphohydrolases